MTQPPLLTDRTALARHRARALQSASPALFLQEDAALEVEERLSEVNRTFTAPAVVTPFPQIWRKLMPGALIVPDDDVLALKPDAHDLVIHAVSLHWANDPAGQLIQCRRALGPDGLFMGALFGGNTLHELRAAISEAEVSLTGGLSPRVLPMAEIRDLGGLLQRAGFTLPVADATVRNVTYANAFRLMTDLRLMGETNALAQRHRATPSRQLFTTMAQLYASRFRTPDGRVPATFEVIFLTGWSPGPGQPQPLRPGSATTLLSDALSGVTGGPARK